MRSEVNGKHGIGEQPNSKIGPATEKYNDAFISFERILQADETEWPPREHIPIPEFAANANSEDVVAGLKVAGGCIIRNMVPRSSIIQMQNDIRPSLEADKSWQVDAFFPPSTKRACGLIAKSRTFALDIVGNELYQSVCDAFLTTKSYPYYGDRDVLNISRPQVDNTTAFSIRPGNSRNQALRRHDDIHYADRPRVDTYLERTNSREFGVGFFVAGTRSTRETGATGFIPGSHLEATIQPPDEDFAQYAELNPGDGLFILSSCYCGGSANTTCDEETLLFSCFMTRGYLRQEENQYLSVPIEVAKSLPVRVQKLMGYQISNPMLGWVGFKDPRVVLDPEGLDMAAHDWGEGNEMDED